jgi:predicted nucleotide-binding protein
VPQKQQRGIPVEPAGEPELLVPRSQMDQELEGPITQGQEFLENIAALETNLRSYRSVRADFEALCADFYIWEEYNEQLLRSRFSTGKLADGYRIFGFGGGFDSYQESDTYQEAFTLLERDVNGQMRKLRSIREQLGLYKSVALPDTHDGSVSPHIGDKIFIVHGHDGDTKLQVAEFVERVTGERPVILHEQADSGRTIIEKFEKHASEAGFAIILLTADDEGKAKGANQLNPRARQNVVLEFGYFMAKLGRGRVVALHEAGVELPSDVTGVLYKSLAGNWHTELARELKAADIEIDFSRIFN